MAKQISVIVTDEGDVELVTTAMRSLGFIRVSKAPVDDGVFLLFELR